MDILWIVIGIVYIVYKLVKEGDLKIKTVIVAVSTIALSLVCGAIYNKTEDSDLIGVNILGIILCFVPIIIPFAVALYDENKKNTELRELFEQKDSKPTNIHVKKDFELNEYNTQDSNSDNSIHNPKEVESERQFRFRELDIMYDNDIEGFQKLLGYSLPKCEYPFSDKLFRKHRKMVAKWEILSKEGYIPQTDIEINMYGNWEDCKRFMDRSYELYTIKHSDLESIYGAKLTDDLLKHRGEIIELILLREGIKNDGFICRSPLTPAYEKEGAVEAAFELLKN